ncbi:carboxypeptidase-like regulatory domain-containing protein [Bacteroides thetaiotaomicron]|uniref:carboxypeptidase-like regulatory domain-containing protein n=1 Tax=Bacteroides thetaiotaomicron TaxID=818 RepID=UPI0021667E94|nr:carboxypeptidase-like regulatory domain-containing protein [Bacteroides thetaiotaomicron]MCS2621044.1 carboxypeptidase-like regulatory domain-containing protein [Bacteroides thetaiotaomicron]
MDEFGEPIPSASILVEGRSRGVITDLDGTFVIEVLPTDKLVVSFLGMETQTIWWVSKQIS